LFVQQKQLVLFYIVQALQWLYGFDHDVLLMVLNYQQVLLVFLMYHHLDFLMIVGYNWIQLNPKLEKKEFSREIRLVFLSIPKGIHS
jgi:hypothetical protein